MEIPEIEIDELAQRLEAGMALFDVREADEHVVAHIPGAVLVPLGAVPDRVDEFRVKGPVHVVCAGGGRSAQAVQFLRANGVDAVNVAGGTVAWIESGRRAVSGEEPR